MCVNPKQIRSIVAEGPWSGTLTELTIELRSAGADQPFTPPQLGVWLRRLEPELWWTHGISVRFSRTGRRRTVHLAQRELTANAPLASDGTDLTLAVTTEN